MLKKLSLVLVASLSLGLLVGCSGGDEGAGPAAGGPPVQNDGAKPVDDGQLGGATGGANKDGAAAPPAGN